eukprot:TRINITY_DN4380_c6_g1_i1.p1 TRINITY_DN4380_c6_g1~~TRINITY_DN4380_c6_g1_i1.p1  ORF type:complete len:371 (+),score=122.71 TRINITY_DN4380_c6_g1_i1:72-1184(+)
MAAKEGVEEDPKWSEDGRRLTPLTPEEVAQQPTPGERQDDRQVETDYSKLDDPTLRKGITDGGHRAAQRRGPAVTAPVRPHVTAAPAAAPAAAGNAAVTEAEEAGAAAAAAGAEGGPVNGERMENPFQRLHQLELLRSGNADSYRVLTGKINIAATVRRKPDGSWSTNTGLTMADVHAADGTQSAGPTVAAGTLTPPPARHQNMVDALYGKNLENDLKTEIADYLKRREDMQKWWVEKMKDPPGKNAPGQVLGVKMPPRDIVYDYRMMVNQYGADVVPTTTEQAERFDTWEWRKRFIGKVPQHPVWWKWTRRAVIGTCVSMFVLKEVATQLGAQKYSQEWRSMKIHDTTLDPELGDPYHVYRNRCAYPYN